MTPNRELETRMLNLLRDAKTARKYANKVRGRFLSPEGQVILKSILYYKGKVSKGIVSLKDLWGIIKSQYPNHDLKEVKKVLLTMRDIKDDSSKLELVTSLWEEHSSRLMLSELAVTASSQLESGRINLEGLRDILKPREIDSGLDIKKTNFAELSKKGMIPERFAVGIPGIDENFGGGIARRELGIIAGPPKRGKSALLANIGGRELGRGFPILYISLADLFERDIMVRFASWLSKLPDYKLEKKPGVLKKLQRKMEKVGGILYVADLTSRKTTLSDLEGVIADATDRDSNIRMVFVDRAETISVTKRDSKRHELAEIYTDLRRIAGRYDVAMWVDSQADSRAYTSKRVGMDKASEDKIGKAGVTDLWIGVTRDQEERDVLWLTIDGRRRIKQELFRVRFNTDNFRMKEEETYEGEQE